MDAVSLFSLTSMRLLSVAGELQDERIVNLLRGAHAPRVLFLACRQTEHSILLAPLLDYEYEQEHESEAERNSRVATGLILPNVPRFHRL